MGAASRALLFSAFEPSGDALAARVIEALKTRDVRVYGFGGPRMEAAGAELLERTTQHGSMFLDSVLQAFDHRRRLARLRSWLGDHAIDALVPVDSPAANWSICRSVRRGRPQARIVHLVAPQLWAWAPWRIRRLRRLTDRVLCLLPFEEPWLERRGVPATFVGHPAFDRVPAEPRGDLPAGHPRLVLLPGSRRAEITRNWPTMLEAFRTIKRDHADLLGVVAVLDEGAAALVRELAPPWPRDLDLVTGRTEAVLDWCDLALVVSGTVTLQITARNKPMVVMYNMSATATFVAGMLISTRTFTLPNLVSEWAGLGRAVPELVPHHGRVRPVAAAVNKLLADPSAADRQRALLADVAARFGTRDFDEFAPRALLAALSNGESR